MNNWRPISEAPKGNGIILLGREKMWRSGFWDAAFGRWSDQEGYPLEFEPTHFMEIAPPGAEQPKSVSVSQFADELRKWWSFGDGQQHTHSWHDREDFITKKLPELFKHAEQTDVNQRLLAALTSARRFIGNLRVPQSVPDAALQIMQGEAVLLTIEAAIAAAGKGE